MVRRSSFTEVILVAAMCILAHGCGENGLSPDTPSRQALEVLYPRGGETFYVGDTVQVRFRANPDSLSSILVELAKDGRKRFDMIAVDGALPATDTVFEWVVGLVESEMNYPSDSCVLWLHEYNNPSEAYSGLFAVRLRP